MGGQESNRKIYPPPGHFIVDINNAGFIAIVEPSDK